MILGRPIATGNTAELYLQHGKIVKLYHPQFPEGAAEYEANKQKIACSCGLCVPQILEVTHYNGRQAIVMEYVKGPTLGALIRQNPSLANRYLSLCTDMQLELHIKIAVGLEAMKGKLQRQLQAATVLDSDLQQKLLTRLAQMPMELRLCHGDFHMFNLIQSGSSFQNAGAAAPNCPPVFVIGTPSF